MVDNGLIFNGNKYTLKKTFMKFRDFLCKAENCKSIIRISNGENKAVMKSYHNHDNENVDPAPNAAKFVLANEDLEENFAEIITDQKNETWLYIDGFRYKKSAKTDHATE